MDSHSSEIIRKGFAETINLYDSNCKWYPDTDFKKNQEKGDFLLIQNSGLNYCSEPFKTTYYQVSVLAKGQSNRTINGSLTELNTNTLLFLSPQHTTSYIASMETTEGYDLLFTKRFLLESKIPVETLDMLLWTDPTHKPAFEIYDADKAINIFEKIKEEAKRSLCFYRQIVRYSIIELLFRINRIDKQALQEGEHPSTQGYKIYKDFKQLVDKHFKKHRSVKEYAELLHITPKHLSEIVKQQSGYTALDLIHNRIITEAKNMLGFTNKPSKQIAYDLGFKTPSYFSRFFKNKMRISPSKYRKNRSIEH